MRATVLTRVEYSGVLLWTFLWLGQNSGSVWLAQLRTAQCRKKVWFQNCLISKSITSFKMALLETSSLRNNVFNTIMSCHCMVDGCEFEGELSLIWKIAILINSVLESITNHNRFLLDNVKEQVIGNVCTVVQSWQLCVD